MKSLLNIIQEKLKIGSKTKISKEKNILDKDINSIDELHDVIKQYFENSNINTSISDVTQQNAKWKTPYAKIDITTGAHFEVNIYNNKKRTNQLRFAEWRDGFLMQLLVYNQGRAKYGRVHGYSPYNEFRVGNNLLKFIETIIKQTKENHPICKDPNLLEIFKEL